MRGDVANDEDFLSRTNQAEFPAGDLLDGFWIFSEPPGLVAQACVLDLVVRQRRGKLVVLFARLHHRDETTVADQCIGDDYRGDEQQDAVDDAASATRLVPVRQARCAPIAFGHDASDVTPFSSKVQVSNNVNDNDLVIVLTTLPDDEAGGVAFADAIVADRLAACVNIYGPMRSVYRWKGSIERDAERQVSIKTTRRRLPALEARVRALHSYQLPEWIVLAADEVSAGYLQWVRDETSDAARTR